MRIAEFSESSNLRTQIALSGYPREHASSSADFNFTQPRAYLNKVLGGLTLPYELV